MVRVALQGCIHGEMCRCYNNLPEDIDVIIWAGDVQTLRFQNDLESLACPPKYRRLGDFTKYWHNELTAPALTIFIGGNHESSAHLAQLPFGGWVAPNMFYLGYSGVIQIKSDRHQSAIRLAGLSGIYSHRDYHSMHSESPPFNSATIRSVYHVRELDIARLRCVSQVTALISHDWPSDLFDFVEEAEHAKNLLLRRKPYFEQDIANGQLGNPHTSQLLYNLQPRIWCAAHLHVNYHCSMTYRQSPTADQEVAPQKCLFLTHDKPKLSVATSIWETDTNTIQTPFTKDPILLDERGGAGREEGASPEEPSFELEQSADGSDRVEVSRVKRAKVSATDPHICIDLEWLLILRRSYDPNQFSRFGAVRIETARILEP